MFVSDAAVLDEAYIVTVGYRHTRQMFYCTVDPTGSHWIFVDTDRREYVGPPFTPLDHDFQLQHLVADWWAAYSEPSP